MITEKDLQLTTELTQGALTSNAATIKAFVDARLADYDVEKYIGKAKEAKADRAELNKAADRLNDARKSLEKEFNAPFEEFKRTITDAVKSIKTASGKLDEIVKAEEQREKDEKRAQILEIWNKKEFTLVPLDRIFNDKWLNKTIKLSAIEADIDSIIGGILKDLDVINRLDPQDVALIKSVYLETLDIGAALARADALKANRERLAAEAQARQSHAIAVEVAEQRDEEQTERHEQIVKEVEQRLNGELLQNVEQRPVDPLDTFALVFTGKRSTLFEMRRFMTEHNITYKKLVDNGDGTFNI